MKVKTAITIIFLIVALVILCGFTFDKDILRVHIRANSNQKADQELKEEVAKRISSYIFEDLANNFINDPQSFVIKVEQKVNEILESMQVDVKAKAYLKQEFFPAKHFNGKVFESGVYTSVIVNLGEGKGDNWWCALYPPLNYGYDGNKTVLYKSRIIDALGRLKGEK